MKIGIIIEARTGSKRLPNKVLLKVKKKTLLEFMVHRLNKVKKVNNIIVATTNNIEDNKIEKLFKNKNKKIKVFRGSEENVFKRVLQAANKNSLDIIISLTGDCPLIDISVINQMLNIFLINKKIDFLTNAHFRSFPDGMDVQIVKYAVLKKTYKLAKNKRDFEHTTLTLRKNLHLFNVLHFSSPEELYWPSLGLTLDEWGDYLLIKKIIEDIYFKKKIINFNCRDIIEYLKNNKKLLRLNSNIKRNTYEA